MNPRDWLGPSDLPAPDARIHGSVVRVALALVGVALSVLVYSRSGGWLGLGVLISLIGALEPAYLLGWVLSLYLALGELGQHDTLHWQLLVLLAGVHLLHICSMLAMEIPWRSWVQPAVFRVPLLRFIAIQVPCQLVAVGALELLGPNAHGHRPVSIAVFALIGAVALGALALVLLSGAENRWSADR